MRKPEFVLTVLLAAISAFVLGLVLAGSLAPGSLGSSPWNRVGPERVVFPDAGSKASPPVAVVSAPVDFADVIERANPAVVNVTATGREKLSDRTRRLFSNPLDFFGGRDPHEGLELPQRGSATGFFVDKTGYLLTNDHVIDKAERVDVTLFDGATLRATVVGRDPVTDLALLKLDKEGDYPAIPLGDSDQLRVGEWVCAIGNPLRLYDHTVTVGVVSFKGRTLFNPSFDNYIQTDAAINVGNSGGPLLNARGEAVGIATAVSQQGQGISFAVPSSTARDILPQLKEQGRVARGYLGISLDDVDSAYQKQLGLHDPRGAVVIKVNSGSAAEKAGIRRYDVIVAVNDRAVATAGTLVKAVAGTPPGTEMRFTLVRDGKTQHVNVILDAREIDQAAAVEKPLPPRAPEGKGRGERLGVIVENLTPDLAHKFQLPKDVEGVVVSRVEPLSDAAATGLRVGDLITEVNRQPIASVADFKHVVAAAQPGDVLLAYVVRSGDAFFVAKIRIEE